MFNWLKKLFSKSAPVEYKELSVPKYDPDLGPRNIKPVPFPNNLDKVQSPSRRSSVDNIKRTPKAYRSSTPQSTNSQTVDSYYPVPFVYEPSRSDSSFDNSSSYGNSSYDSGSSSSDSSSCGSSSSD